MTQLTQDQKAFDNQTLDYDLGQHPMPTIILGEIQKLYPNATSLDTLHEVIPPHDIQRVQNTVSHALLNTNFYQHFDEIVSEHVVPQLGTDVLIQKFGNLRILIPNQDKFGAVLIFHQGRWVGNGLGLRTVWMPFTPCFESNSMQIMDLDKSREMTRQAKRENWSYEYLDSTCADNSWPITLQPGQAHLFFQEHIHGNIPNRTDKTRVSIDIRLLVRDGQPHRKWPGAYFRKLHDRSSEAVVSIDESKDIVVCYMEYDGVKTRNIDLHFQTLAVRHYCTKKGYKFPYQHGENEGLNHAHLKSMIHTGNVNHLIMFSIFSLPDDDAYRQELLETALCRGLIIHFANEEIVLQTQKDLDNIQYIRNFTNDWSSPVRQLEEELRLDK